MQNTRNILVPDAAFCCIYAKAERQLLDLRRYLRSHGSVVAAMRYIDALISYCESLGEFPYRGTSRDDLLPGLRITHFRGRTVIAFSIFESRVEIPRYFHGGRDYQRLLGQVTSK